MIEKIQNTAIELPRGRTVFGRPIRPTAFGLMVIATALGVGSFMGHTLLLGARYGQTIAVMCALAGVSYLVGWIIDRPIMARISDLIVFATFAAQTAFLWIEQGGDFPYRMVTLAPGTVSAWIGIGIAIIAAGAFWLNGRPE